MFNAKHECGKCPDDAPGFRDITNEKHGYRVPQSIAFVVYLMSLEKKIFIDPKKAIHLPKNQIFLSHHRTEWCS